MATLKSITIDGQKFDIPEGGTQEPVEFEEYILEVNTSNPRVTMIGTTIKLITINLDGLNNKHVYLDFLTNPIDIGASRDVGLDIVGKSFCSLSSSEILFKTTATTGTPSFSVSNNGIINSSWNGVVTPYQHDFNAYLYSEGPSPLLVLGYIFYDCYYFGQGSDFSSGYGFLIGELREI